MTLLKSLLEWTDDELNPEDHLQNYSNHRDIEDKINYFNGLVRDVVDPDYEKGVDDFPHINEYTDSDGSSNSLNTDLWRIKNGHEPASDSIHRVKELSKELDEFPAFDEKLTVYSGLSREHLKSKIPSGIVHIPSLLSASLSPNVAHAFSTAHGRFNEGHILRIHIPPRQKHGGLVELASNNEHESEYLFHPNKVFKISSKPTVLKDEDGKNIHIWDAHVMNNTEIESNKEHPEVQSYLRMKSLFHK